MRLLQLDLERYGPFTGTRLSFRPEAKLHVVYGPNEAGKSCALAAITDLLFGFEHAVRFDFVHNAREMRIGAALSARDGTKIAFRRRRGNKNTLIDADDKPLRDDALTPFLGGLTREVFRRAFGLSTQALRQGAEDMLRSEGDVGAALFAAASGLRGLNDLRRGLELEADGIFAPRASQNRRFYQAMQRFEDARKSMRDAELRPADWTALNTHIAELAVQLSGVSGEIRVKAEQRAQLARLKRLAPCVLLIDRDLETLEALGPLPDVPAGFTAQLRERLAALSRAAEALRNAGAAYATALEEHELIEVEESVIERTPEIVRLFGETGAYANNHRDLPRIQFEANEFKADLAQLATRLALSDAQEMERIQPGDGILARVRTLLAEGRSLTGAARARDDARKMELESLEKLTDRREKSGAPSDPRPLRERLSALGPELKQIERRNELDRTLQAETRSLVEAASRLQPAIKDLDALALASLPSAETIARFRKELDRTTQEAERARDKVQSAAEEISKHERELAALTASRPVPSTEAIAIERGARDHDWARLRASFFGEPLSGSPLADRISGFERHTVEADRLSDEAVENANIIERHALSLRQRDEQLRLKSEFEARLTKAQTEHAEIWRAWAHLWAAAEVSPLPPVEMAAWLAAVNGLLARRNTAAAQREELAIIAALAHRLEPELKTLAEAVGLTIGDEQDAVVIAAGIEQRLKMLSENWDRIRDLGTLISEAQKRLETLERTETDAENDRAKWAQHWAQALPAIGLLPDAHLEEAEAALNVWSAVPGTLRERDNRVRRVNGMIRNIQDFEAQASALIQSLAPDLAGASPDIAIKTLQERLDAARRAQALKSDTTRRVADSLRLRDEVKLREREAKEALSKAAELIPADADLTDQLARLTESETLHEKVAERRQQLLEQSDGLDEKAVRAELMSFNPDQAEAALERLASEAEHLHQDEHEIYAERDRDIRRRDTLALGVGSELAAAQRRNAEAELSAAAREWTVLKLGALLIGAAVDRHRADQQDPLMARAGALFAMLTGGAFDGFTQEYDDDDIPRLDGRRPSGDPVKITEMSEGTRDQLYMALRLAYLEEYASRAEPAPFIGDDLLASFDDARTANGLRALAAIGDRVQPILFTHHRRVAEIAEKALGDEAEVLELIQTK